MVLVSPLPRPARRYVRPPEPLYFPANYEAGVFPGEQDVPESRWHRLAGDALARSIEHELGQQVLVSCDQFVYFDAVNVRRRLAPDVAFRVGSPAEILRVWKTWERGVPHVGVEIVSISDAPEQPREEELRRYREAGIAEVVWFDRDANERPIRIWDRLEDDLVERDMSQPGALRCDAIGCFWCLYDDPELGTTLRLARDPEGRDLLLTRAEVDRSAREAERSAKEVALARVAELEAELARRSR